MTKELAKGGGKALKASGKAMKKATSGHAPRKAAKAAKKAPAKAAKHANKHPPKDKHHEKGSDDLVKAFHHLQRASSLLSLVQRDSAGDLLELLETGGSLYRRAAKAQRKGQDVDARAARGLLAALEHLASAGLYSARLSEGMDDIDAPQLKGAGKELLRLEERLASVQAEGNYATRLQAVALELVRRSDAAAEDQHLAWELRMAAEGMCSALEAGLE